MQMTLDTRRDASHASHGRFGTVTFRGPRPKLALGEVH
jgi:hypothetical protein